MRLTGEEIAKEGIITNLGPESIQQQGVDLRLKSVLRFVWAESEINESGYIPATGKTRLPNRTEIEPINMDDKEVFMLSPGYYEVIFDEGCNMPNNRVMDFISRSSLVRCGAEIISGQFDAGFKTDNMGCFMAVYQPVQIERHARVAQTRISETSPVKDDNMYNGQWQNDKQRKC